MPRPKKWAFEDKKEICYKLYMEEQRPMREIVKYFVESSGMPAGEQPK